MPGPLTRLRRSVREGPSDAPGRVVDVLGRLGLVGYGVVAWLARHIAASPPRLRTRRAPSGRSRVGGTVLAVAALAALVVDYLVGKDSARETTAQTIAADLLALPDGRLLLGAVAGVVLALAAALTYTGVRRTFMGDLGHLARAAALAVVGLLAMGAAVSADPERAGGLDAALRALGQTGAGAALLVVVATGFAAYGVFCFVDAATRRA